MIGRRLGSYEISAKLGEGGMGEVYRATDTRLKREVAIKVLPAAFTEDKERLARFEREAQLLAQLHHPNIASIFGLEESFGVKALVMELVEGPTLAERLGSGPFSLTESLSIALQIAQALEEAHEKGIVHRDLKPQNIKASRDGTIKILDFGLAKAMDPAAGSAAAADLARSPTLMNSPTLTAAHGTQLGMILGTAAYMAPEQARGASVDKRADIWAFGVVLYEMLTGERLFEGESVVDTLSAVMRKEIDFTLLPGSTPRRVRELLRRCLERNPRRRLRDIGEARLALEGVASGEAETSGTPRTQLPPRPTWQRWLPWSVAALAVAGGVAVALFERGAQAPAAAPVTRFELAWPGVAGGVVESATFELSPDGRALAIVAQGQIWVRTLDSLATKPIAGTDGASYPFWSPDGTTLGFFAGEELRRVSRDGGLAQKICDAPDGRGGAWGRDGTIVFSDRYGSQGLSRVGDRGGKPLPLPKISPPGGEGDLRYPQFLPDGRHYLFTFLSGSPETAGIYVSDLDGTAPVRLLDGSDHALYAPAANPREPGHLLFRRRNILMALPFDAGRLRVVGEMFPVAEPVGTAGNTGHGAFSVSTNGVLALSELSPQRETLAWVDRSGHPIETLAERLALRGFTLSPDERTLAYADGVCGGGRDIWLQPTAGGSPSRFTFGDGPGWAFPLWSPDGKELAYATHDCAGEARYEIRRRRLDRSGAEAKLWSTDHTLALWDWSPDGRFLVFTDERDSKLWLLPLAGGGKPEVLTPAIAKESCAQFSADGRFLAYASTAQGSIQVFVQPFPATGALWQVSTAGGSTPRWRADGRELYYRAEDGKLMAVAVNTGSGSFEAGTPQALFDGIASWGNLFGFTYQPARDGQRFLVSHTDLARRSPIVVTLNWQADLRR